MCLAIPARVIRINHDKSMAMVDINGIRKDISIVLLDEVAVNDYVLVHTGYALERLDPHEATQTLALFESSCNEVRR